MNGDVFSVLARIAETSVFIVLAMQIVRIPMLLKRDSRSAAYPVPAKATVKSARQVKTRRMLMG